MLVSNVIPSGLQEKSCLRPPPADHESSGYKWVTFYGLFHVDRVELFPVSQNNDIVGAAAVSPKTGLGGMRTKQILGSILGKVRVYVENGWGIARVAPT